MNDPIAAAPSPVGTSRRRFHRIVAGGSVLAAAGWFPAWVRAQPAKLKVGVVLPKSGVLAQLANRASVGPTFRWAS